jgi:cell division protein YceG involved in septum cleavage
VIPHKIKKTTKIKLYILVACVAFAIIGSFVVLFHYSSTPTNPNGDKYAVVLVDIPSGSSFAKTTEILNKAGLIKSSFLLYCGILGSVYLISEH